VIAAADGSISVTLDEAQLTSIVASELAQRPDPFLNEPLVLLRNGQIELYGKARTGIFTANVSIFVQASVDAEGQPQFCLSRHPPDNPAESRPHQDSQCE
jgi:hypothetical protein